MVKTIQRDLEVKTSSIYETRTGSTDNNMLDIRAPIMAKSLNSISQHVPNVYAYSNT